MAKLLHLIVACSENRVIGRDGKLPWHIPEDLKFFNNQTAGQVCVLGRVCFDSWPGATRDGRKPIVLTHRPIGREGARIVTSAADALALAETLPDEIYVCGGQKIYEETLALRRRIRLHLTLIHADIAGDRFFPEWRDGPWLELAKRESSDANYRYTFFMYERR